MPVDTSDILHVLAHELRTPVGIAHGYVRLLLDDRLPDQDRRRALEQTQKALTRLTALSHEATALAAWYEQPADADPSRIRLGAILGRLSSAAYGSPVIVDVPPVAESFGIRTMDQDALAGALIDVVRATARECRGEPCAVSIRVANGHCDVLTGRSEHLAALAAGPDAPDMAPLALERGGLGLALVHAAVVLDAHGAARWAPKGSRQAAGVRLPLEEQHL